MVDVIFLPQKDLDQKKDVSLRIQVCPKKGINPTVLLWGWDWGQVEISSFFLPVERLEGISVHFLSFTFIA